MGAGESDGGELVLCPQARGDEAETTKSATILCEDGLQRTSGVALQGRVSD
eukprot:CAMPEP_0183544544 /NCGR_PEP_ID=MMETSP0371-20130417/47611_1 /TAXON_ID=268820 /ORGANISM="Peridinium aciculiferum, Strain PAER-2" /LENGTH=50 /DNA_ID=CAMNT_0025746369 /DNA_START=52 /DNA_END=203 /DNA_ORIENTATION=+